MKLKFNLFKKPVPDNKSIDRSDPPVFIPKTRGTVTKSKEEFDTLTIQKLNRRYIAFDVETTGRSPAADRIIEIGAVLFEEGKITKTFNSLVNAETFIPQYISDLTHITNEMVKDAPKEYEIYPRLIAFLGDALDQKTVICAHNASFDMNFLSETLMRLGYNGNISYIDTLSLSRKFIKGLNNYKQNTVAKHFGIINRQAHRAVADAETCGRILFHLLKIAEKSEEERLTIPEKKRLSDQEKEVCAFIQHSIMKNGGKSDLLGFEKLSGGYVDVDYVYSIVRFKFAKKGKYLIVDKNITNDVQLHIEPCTMSEGGSDYVRVFFNNPFELEPFESYFYAKYRKSKKSAEDYFNYYKRGRSEYLRSMAMANHLSVNDVVSLLQSAQKRRGNEIVSNHQITQPVESKTIDRKDIVIHPVHNRVPLDRIKNADDEDKGFSEGFIFWEQGDELRKKGGLGEAIRLFDRARYNGYCSISLYTSYAMAFHRLKDYENEIDILDEGIKRNKAKGNNVGKLEARRDKAIQCFNRQQNMQIKK